MENKKTALVLTNHMAEFHGSEIVAIEVARELKALGFSVTVHCNYLSASFKKIMDQDGISSSDDDS